MSLRLYTDVQVRRAVVEGLRARGVEILTAQADGAAELDDPDLLDRAMTMERVLFTQDEDLPAEGVRRQRAGDDFSGIILFCSCAATNPAFHRKAWLSNAAAEDVCWFGLNTSAFGTVGLEQEPPRGASGRFRHGKQEEALFTKRQATPSGRLVACWSLVLPRNLRSPLLSAVNFRA